MEPEDAEMATVLVDSRNMIQKLRVQISNRIDGITREGLANKTQAEDLHEFLDKRLLEIEKDCDKRVMGFVCEMEIYTGFFKGIRGIGPMYATSLIAGIKDIGRFDTISKLWAYCGLHTIEECNKCGKRCISDPIEKDRYISKTVVRFTEETERKGRTVDADKIQKTAVNSLCECEEPEIVTVAPKRHKGGIVNWSPKMRTLCWKIAGQFVRTTDSPYRKHYEKFKAYENEHHPELSDGHRDNRARRKTVKLFLSNLWVAWRDLEGLSVRAPYVEEKLGHTTITEP